MDAFKVTLPTTNVFENCYKAPNGEYENTEEGGILIVLSNLIGISNRYPDALKVERLGVGVFLPWTEDQSSKPSGGEGEGGG